jgi:general secretion pathway protein B
MSYILDALKKSEKERQRGTAPDVLTSQDVITEEPRKRRLLPYLIFGALILNAGLLVWWLGWNPKKPQMVSQSTAAPQVKVAESAKVAPAVDAPLATPSPEPVKTESLLTRTSEERPADRSVTAMEKQNPNRAQAVPQDQPAQTRAGKKRSVENGPSPTVTAKETHEVRPSMPQQTSGDRAPVEPQPVAHNETPIKNKIYSVKELPASLQQNLPDFSISTHLYSGDTTSRVIRVNGQMLREGQILSAGLKLEEITPDGVIFSFQNYRFLVGLR